MPYNFEFKVLNTECIILINGEFVMQETSHDFKEKVEFQLDLGINKFILNAEKMTALNSEGYQVLLELLTAARIAGGDLSIINCEHVKTESEFHRDFNLYFYTEATS